ncbi:unnamed protein product [Paramecium octaurelia]|uniref:WD40-repeat-containing domain n=1 Tax=Paramecium octaurelia TaxID=43137 RepID=A0A8S1WTE8_PAROT|nr:unnamed protein product [Paramecium octaurelia]
MKSQKSKQTFVQSMFGKLETDVKTIGFKKIISIIEDVVEKRMNNLQNNTQEIIEKLKICTTKDIIYEILKIGLKIYWYKFNNATNTVSMMNWKILLRTRILIMILIQNSLTIPIDFGLSSCAITQINTIRIKINQTLRLQSNNFWTLVIQICHNYMKLNQSDVKCYAIVFDTSGQIMVSTKQNDINVWMFQNGKMKLVKLLQGHTHLIQCLVYIKKQHSFISGALDKSIRCWQQQDQSNWNSSQPYQQHTDYIMCIVLNSNEDLLFHKSIKAWKVDFNQNKLAFLYSLDRHDDYVISLSLNQLENYLVSCAFEKNQIIIWQRRGDNNKFEFRYFVKQSVQEQGHKVKFIKENQFIWITGGITIDKLYVFELIKGVYQENQEKSFQLVTNNQNVDECRFPIMYNKEKDFIVLRHKNYIYIIREIKDGKFKKVCQLNFDAYSIYGTITNNGQYLVFWDEKNQGYSIFELSNK